MKILKIKNSKINEQNVILNISGNLEAYLTSLNPDFSDLTKWEKFNGSSINKNGFTLNLNDLEIKEVDYLAVDDFPFAPGRKAYFYLDNFTYNNNSKSFTVNFKLDLLHTFPIFEVIDFEKKIKMEHGHLRQNINFEGERNEIKEFAFFRKEQATYPNIKFISKKKINGINSPLNDSIAKGTGVQLWQIGFFEKSVFDDDNDETENTKIKATNMRASNLSENVNIQSQDTILFFVPFGDAYIPFKSNWNDGNPDYEFHLNGQIFYDNYKDDPAAKAIVITDFAPTNGISYDSAENKIIFDNTIGYLGREQNNIPQALILLDMDKSKIDIEYFEKEENTFFEWEKTEDDFLNDSIIDWSEKQEAILNFSPFKNFEIAFYDEEENESNAFNLNNKYHTQYLINPISKSRIVLSNNKSFSITTEIGSFIKENEQNGAEIENYFFEDNNLQKTNRALELPLENNTWKEDNQQKKGRIISEFGRPFEMATIGAITKGPKAALAAAGASVGHQLFKNAMIKNKPTTTKNNSVELNDNLINGFQSHTLIISEPYENDKKSIAYDFHKFGYYLFENYYHITEILLARSRFNYFKISASESFNIFNENLLRIFKEDYLLRLKNGVWFWNFFTNRDDKDIINERIFKF